MQIYDESTSIFAKAHVNMYKIEMKMKEVPDYVAECKKYLKTEDEDSLRRRLDKIKQAADDVAALFKEVCDAFHSFGNNSTGNRSPNGKRACHYEDYYGQD